MGTESNYKWAVVTFIDILGFKYLVNHLSETEMSDLLEVFHYLSESSITETIVRKSSYDDPGQKIISPPPQVIAFSDSIVRVAYPTEEEDYLDSSKMSVLAREINSMMYIQEELLLNGVLIRGGLTAGKIVCCPLENKLFGPAMNRAYFLESELSRLPRIIIDPDIVCDSSPFNCIDQIVQLEDLYLDEDMSVSIEYFGKQTALHYLRYLSDNYTKIDTLDFSYFNSYFENEFEKLMKKKKVIENGLSKHRDDIRTRQKYFWAAMRLNESVQYFFMVFNNFMQFENIKKCFSFSPSVQKTYQALLNYQTCGISVDSYLQRRHQIYNNGSD